MLTKLGVISAKGGVGKTTTAINLATSMCDFDQDVTLVDANMLNPNISLQLDLPNTSVSLQQVLNSEASIRNAVKAHQSGIKVVPSSISLDVDDVDSSRLGCVLSDLEGTVVLDSPPGIVGDIRHVIEASDKVVVVATPELPSVVDAAKTIRLARMMEKQALGVVLNRVRSDSYELTRDEVEILCEAPVIARIPEDNEVRKSQFHSMPVVRYNPYSKATIEYNFLAARILCRGYTPPDMLPLRRMLRLR